MPACAKETFRPWFEHHVPAHPGGPEVILFPDTFNNLSCTDTAVAAGHVLEAAGGGPHSRRDSCAARVALRLGHARLGEALVYQLLERLGAALERLSPASSE